MKQTSLQKLLAQVRLAGVYHLPHSGQATLERAASELGFACFRISLDESGDINAILATLGHALDFPDWYGANLDALNDCLTDFSWREAPGYVITLSGADALHADATSFTALNEVFASAVAHWQTQNVPLWIFYDMRANGLATLPTLT
jgi:hypothetical protein